jgi:hypothetical protein
MWNRVAALPRAARLQLTVRKALRAEARALAAIGAATGVGARSEAPDVSAALAEAARLRVEIGRLAGAEETSLDTDRADYQRVGAWLRPVVVVRGLLDRAVLRGRARRLRAELRPVQEAVGAGAVAGLLRDERGAPRAAPPELAAVAEAARRRAATAASDRGALLAAFGGRALPGWAHAAGAEAASLGITIAKELRGKAVPRLPGVAGLAAGWWVAQSYTTSRWAAFGDALGLRRGGPRVVSAETYERLEFWLPLLAAATCAWASARLAKLVEQRYAAKPDGAAT